MAPILPSAPLASFGDRAACGSDEEVEYETSSQGRDWQAASPSTVAETLVAAQRLGLQVQSLEVGNSGDFDAAFRAATAARAEAVIVATSRQMLLNRQQIIELAAKHRILLASGWGPWATVARDPRGQGYRLKIPLAFALMALAAHPR